MKIVMYGPLASGVGVVSLLLAGAVARGKLREQTRGTRTFVEANGQRYHVAVRGEGRPAVVFESGQGDFSLTWELLAPLVSRFTTTVAYDRPGLGWSDPSPRPRSVKLMEETARVLQAEMAAASTAGRLVVAQESGHAVQLDQPEVMISVVREGVELARDLEVSGFRGEALLSEAYAL
jgi:pimeloyl-ACP methyl ester carboxylesterase